MILVLVLVALALFGLHYHLQTVKNREENRLCFLILKIWRGYLGSSSQQSFCFRSIRKRFKTFNYGMSGGHLFEAALLLKLMIERKYEIKM
jgi:hypothetical protein